ncbi:MAG: TonB-dependent receptor [Elusimicrobia bacterium]|nr:TonB-dependent receptor [Elusimicrobiota bacterium]
MRLFLATFLVLTQLTANGWTQGDDDELASLESLLMGGAEVISVASTKPESIFNSVSNVTVITRQTIERFNYGSVSEAIESVAGVMVWRTYFLKRLQTFRGGLQEQYANKSLVMINNVPMWHAVTGEGYIDRVPIDAVERIEILRGPASVLYGSNALNGAINIVLRRPKKGERDGQISAGAATTHDKFEGYGEASRAVGQYASTGKDGSYNVIGGMVSESWPMYTFNDEGRLDNKVRDFDRVRSLTASGEWKGHSLLANVASVKEGFLGTTPARSAGIGNPHEREFELVSYAYSFGPEWWNLKYSATYDRQRRNFSRADDDNTRTDTVGSRTTNSLSARVELFDYWSVEAGGDHDYRVSYRYVNYDPRTMLTLTTSGIPNENEMRDRTAWEGSAYVQLGFDKAPWRFLVGSRYTNNQLFGDNLSSRGSAVYQISERQSVKAVAGQSFRAPTLFEQYFLTKPVTAGGVVGNPGLSPEKSDSVELSYLASWGHLFGQLTGYWTQQKNRIFRSLGTFTRAGETYNNVNFYTNANEFNARGLELELRYSRGQTEAYAAWDYIDGNKGDVTTITNTGDIPRETYNYKYVPRYTLSSGLSHAIGGFFLGGNVTHYSSVDTLRTRLGHNSWLDLNAGYATGRIRHTLGVRNVTASRVSIPEYVRQRVVESVPLQTGRRLEYTFNVQF